MRRKSTLLSVLFIACIFATIVIGSTYAYFIDDVQSTGNVIKAGNLQVSVKWTDDVNQPAETWNELRPDAQTPIFGNDRWEPNYTEVRYIRVTNEGELAFQYRLDIVPTLTAEKPGYQLGNVIEAYVQEVGSDYTAPTGYQDLANMTSSGTVASMIASDTGAYYGKLLAPKQSITLAVVLHMDHEAGNEYQGLSVGDGFQLVVHATQTPFERDAFSTGYDAGAQLPENPFKGGTASMPVSVANGVTTADVTLDGGEVLAFIPAGTKVNPGTTSLTLNVTRLNKTASGITADEGETLLPVDVHVDGVAADNDTVIIVTLSEALIPGLNQGNTALYHVENGRTVAMTQQLTASALTAHNQYYYNPADGTLMLGMKSFSEVAVVADTENAWEGKFDYTWYDASKTELFIANADQLAAFGAIVGGMNGQTQDSFAGKTVKVIADINLGYGVEEHTYTIFYPIGYYNSTGTYKKTSGGSVTSSVSSFEGIFDGQGHTISNIYQNTWEMFGDYNDGYSGTPNHYKDAMGLFGYVKGGTVKNLTVDNFKSDGEYTPTGVIAAYADGNSTFENIAITKCNPRVYNTGNGGIIGIAGDTSAADDDHITLKNITVDNSNKISALWGSWDVACGGLVGMFRGAGHVNMNNCHVAAQMDVFNDVCGNYQYYWYRYSGMMVGTNKNMITDKDGYTVPETSKFHAENCTVHFGNWNDYYYCELVANSLASYTHDHQFSRLTQISSLDEIKSGDTWTKTGNFLLISGDSKTCYHIVKNSDGTLKQHLHDDAGEETVNGKTVLKENNQIVYLPFNQLFTGYGWGVKHIPVYNGEDYAFEGITILDRVVADSAVKFEKADTAQDSYFSETTVTIGELFTAANIDDAKLTIKGDKVQVFVSPVAGTDSTAGAVYTANTTDWTQGTLEFSGEGAATITITDYYFCTPTTINVKVEATNEFVTKFDKDFLYRVGNNGTVALGNLFKLSKDEDVSNVTVQIVSVSGNAEGTYKPNDTWTSGTIKFSGTGVVEVTIDANGAKPVTLYLEVVDATNTTTASFSGNTVLLNDVSTSSTLSTSGIIYGNGFTVNMENAPISEKNGAVFHLYDGAVLKNLGIVGKEFTTVAMNVNDTNYGVSAVRAWGTVTIENCYISGCRSAVSVTGTELTIKDSVIANGVYANIDFRSGILNLHNVTTINEPHSVNGTTVVGLGIVGNMTASAGRQINITGTLTQYNWVSEEDCGNIKASGVNSIFNSVFTDSKYAPMRYTYNGTTYVNTGILSMCSDFGSSAVTGVPDNYDGINVSASIGSTTGDGYVWAPGKAGTLTKNDMKYHDTVYEWIPSDQGTSYIPPAFDFVGAGLTAENGVVQIEYESGSSYTLSAETVKTLFTATKYNQPLTYTVSMNNVDYTGKDVVFDSTASQTYTITYTVTDNLVYDKDGKLTETTYEVTKELKVFATVVDKGADAPEFTFYYGTTGSASAGTPHTAQPTNSYTSTIKKVGEDYYIMPNVSATSANAIGSKTIDSVTVYYPIVDGINVRSGSSNDYDFTRYYPVFKAVKISDNGTEYTYSDTKEMPATVAWVSAEIDSGNGASSLNDGFGLYNNQYLCKIQKKAGNAESGGTSVVKYSYTALDGNTYHYYVGYRFYDEDEGGLCVTPDTLITLADGTQKQIQHVTYDDQLLVWDPIQGEYIAAPVAYIHDHGAAENAVISMTFEDGTVIKVVNAHQFFVMEDNCFVTLDAMNVNDYIGKSFVKRSGNENEIVKLASVSIATEYVEAWGVNSAYHYNILVEDFVTMDFEVADLPLFTYFTYGDNMMYDESQMQADIDQYGLYTYEDFADYLTIEQFEAFNVKYMKISVGKGQFTYEGILKMIDKYLK